MIRPLRRIRERGCELADPAAHWPSRPAWMCAADGEPWPCEPLRNHLLATLSRQEIGVWVGGYYQFAVIELAAAPAEVHRQLLGWTRTA